MDNEKQNLQNNFEAYLGDKFGASKEKSQTKKTLKEIFNYFRQI